MSRKAKKDWDLDTLLSVVGFVFELVRVVVNALRKRNGNVDHLRRLLKEPELVDQIFDLIVPVGSESNITIPTDATAEGLIEKAKVAFERAGIPFTRFNKNSLEIIQRDLELVRGQTLQVLKHTFGRYWTTREGRDLQSAQRYDGNAAAFLVWVIQTKKKGWSVSIADTDDRLFLNDVGQYVVPYFDRDDQYRNFDLYEHDVLNESFVLVAFRAI